MPQYIPTLFMSLHVHILPHSFYPHSSPLFLSHNMSQYFPTLFILILPHYVYLRVCLHTSTLLLFSYFTTLSISLYSPVCPHTFPLVLSSHFPTYYIPQIAHICPRFSTPNYVPHYFLTPLLISIKYTVVSY